MSLKQSNKSHKTGGHRSKGQIRAQDGGRIETTTQRHKRQLVESRMARMNNAKQLRTAKRQEAIKKKRHAASTPHLTVIISLCGEATSSKQILKLLTPEYALKDATEDRATFTSPMLKRQVALIAASGTDIYDVMELVRVADTVLFTISAVEDVTEFGQLCNSVVKTIGAASIAHLLVGLDEIPQKKRGDAKKGVQKFLERDHPEIKLYTASNADDTAKIVWGVANIKKKPIKWRDNHPYMLAENIEHVAAADDSSKGTLIVKGYLRGHSMNVNDLVHLPGHGACQLTKITKADFSSKHGDDVNMEGDDTHDEEITAPTMEKLQSLDTEVAIDPMDAEQTWPSEEEIKAAQSEGSNLTERHAPPMTTPMMKVKVPKGTSSYQARWIAEAFGLEDGDEDDEEEEDEMDADAEMQVEDDGIKLGGGKQGDDAMDSTSESGVSTANSTVSSIKEGDELLTLEDASKKKSVRYDLDIDLEEEKRVREELKLARDEQTWPDEVDTPTTMAARVRFQKYRGLQSFRHSGWDPREELPIEYARVFQFQHFKQTRKRVLAKVPTDDDEKDWVNAGCAVSLHLANVPASYMESLSASAPLTLFGLLEHENKMTLLNFKLSMHSSYDRPVKSKEPLEFYTGLRKFSACPTFSQHTIGNKHKFERYFQPGGTVVASVFAPIMYPPGPVVVFRRTETNSLRLVATGSLLSVDPDRIVVKRIRLVGHPYKLNKRTAVIRYMFFQPDDIHWFKPVELTTKYGRSGHIKESLGTHGHMKCVFDKPLNAQDTIVMNLYKRVYPKWTYEELK